MPTYQENQDPNLTQESSSAEEEDLLKKYRERVNKRVAAEQSMQEFAEGRKLTPLEQSGLRQKVLNTLKQEEGERTLAQPTEQINLKDIVKGKQPPKEPETSIPTEPKVPSGEEQKKKESEYAPANFDTYYKKLKEEAANLGDEGKSEFIDKMGELNTEREKALELYRENRKALGWAQVAEQVGQALAQLGAAAYGLKHGVDMSGVKFDRGDWRNQYEGIMEDLRASLDDIKEKRTYQKIAYDELRKGKEKEAELRTTAMERERGRQASKEEEAIKARRETERLKEAEKRAEKKTEIANTAAEFKKLEKQKEAASAAIASVQQLKDNKNKKEAPRLNTELRKNIAEAGIPADVAADLLAEKGGILDTSWGAKTDYDTAKAILTAHQRGLENQQRSLIQNKPEETAPTTQQSKKAATLGSPGPGYEKLPSRKDGKLYWVNKKTGDIKPAE